MNIQRKIDIETSNLNIDMNNLDDLMDQFETAKNLQLPEKKKVRLKVVVGCGCGNSHQLIEREVPYDSDLEDGDYVDDFEENDVYL